MASRRLLSSSTCRSEEFQARSLCVSLREERILASSSACSGHDGGASFQKEISLRAAPEKRKGRAHRRRRLSSLLCRLSRHEGDLFLRLRKFLRRPPLLQSAEWQNAPRRTDGTAAPSYLRELLDGRLSVSDAVPPLLGIRVKLRDEQAESQSLLQRAARLASRRRSRRLLRLPGPGRAEAERVASESLPRPSTGARGGSPPWRRAPA